MTREEREKAKRRLMEMEMEKQNLILFFNIFFFTGF